MDRRKVHIYFVPGLAAGEEIFRNIKLPKETYEIHILTWLIPHKKETIQEYAKRMAHRITEENPVLIGVSFGGVVAQEMCEYITPKKCILISSVKNSKEIPSRLRFARFTKAYKLVPTSLIVSSKDLKRYAIGPRSRKRLDMYNHYLHVRDKRYLDWAIANMVNWNRKESREDVIHLHGDADVIFPIKRIENCTICPGGTHIMILNKAHWISKEIQKITSEILKPAML